VSHGLNRRRLALAFLLAVVVFAATEMLVFVLPDPKKAAFNWEANTGGLLFFTAIQFVVFGVPLWAGLYAYLSWVASGRGRENP
jgi:hypothetical protein